MDLPLVGDCDRLATWQGIRPRDLVGSSCHSGTGECSRSLPRPISQAVFSAGRWGEMGLR
jgi:hypothetical protein